MRPKNHKLSEFFPRVSNVQHLQNVKRNHLVALHKDLIVTMNARLEQDLVIQEIIDTPLERFADAVINLNVVPDIPPQREVRKRPLQRKRTGGLDSPVLTALVNYKISMYKTSITF